MSKPKNWLQFTKERFDPLSHGFMILLFFTAHMTLARQLRPNLEVSAVACFFLFLGTIAFFFKLRLYDELKDYEVDVLINPDHPLARGLVTHKDLYSGIVTCIVVELVTFAASGTSAIPGISIAILYSLLMYKEFFIPKLIRPHLTTYAVSHTVVSGFLTLALTGALSGSVFWELGQPLYIFALNSWCLFNIFEFGRKTFLSTEERPNIESYSKIFGRFGAVTLVLIMAIFSKLLLEALSPAEIDVRPLSIYLWCALASLGTLGIAYAAIDRRPLGAIYRVFSSLYIVLIYLGWVLSRGVIQ